MNLQEELIEIKEREKEIEEELRIKVLKEEIIKEGRIPMSRGEFEVFSPLYYIMTYEECLAQILFHKIKEANE